MTSAAASSSSSTQSTRTGYRVGRPQGVCVVTGRKIEPGEVYFAALRETPEAFERLEFTPDAWAAWPAEEKAQLLAFWRTTMREPRQDKKKLLVDDEVLAELFRRLEGVADRDKQAFRFMIGLILMRKKLLIFEDSRSEGEADVWTMRFRKEERTHELIDPKLAEEELDAVGKQVGQILSGGIEEEALEGDEASDTTQEGA